MLQFTSRPSGSHTCHPHRDCMCYSRLNIWTQCRAVTVCDDRSVRTALVAKADCVTARLGKVFFFNVYMQFHLCCGGIYFSLCCIKELSSFGDTVQKIDKQALTAVMFIHFDCSTVNIQKADVYWVETPGALASDQPMKPQQRGQAGVCVSVCICVWIGGRFTGREASVTAINVTSLQTSFGTLREACECNSATSSEWVVESCWTVTAWPHRSSIQKPTLSSQFTVTNIMYY